MSDHSASLIACLPRLRRYARALVGERAGADDLVQDTVERGWNKLSSWRGDGDLRAWLFGIMHNLHADSVRRPALAVVPLDNEHADSPAAHAATNADPSAGLVVRDLGAALQLLPPEQRAVLLLVGLEEMSYEQVATALDLPLGTVMSRLSRGRERLRTLMAGQAAPAPLKVVK